jgi:hypothetical protein
MNIYKSKISASSVKSALLDLGSPVKAASSAWFFKTGKGQYGYGDKFIGVTVPKKRKVAKEFADLPLGEIDKLLKSKIHECRLTALFILIGQFKKAKNFDSGEIVRFYLVHAKYINNWDLVDSSASYILGSYLLAGLHKDREILYKMAKSESMWERGSRSFLRSLSLRKVSLMTH